MTMDFVSLVFIWLLLPLTASGAVTSDQNNNSTGVMTTTRVTPNNFTHDQPGTRETSSLRTGATVTQSVVVAANPTEEKTTKPSATTSPQTTPTTPSETSSPGTQTAQTPTSSTSSQLNSSTEGGKSTTEIQLDVATSATTVVTSHTSIPTTATPSMPSSSTQSQFTNATMTPPLTRPAPSTNLLSATTTSTKPVEHTSTSTRSVTHDNASPSPGLYETSTATTKKPFIHATTAKERQVPPEKSSKGTNHSKTVAGVIGGALVLMMVGFLIIYIKKRKLQKHQITTRDWAGPSPFLEGGAVNEPVTLRSSNRISLSSFLPQRLSKRLSLLPESEEELLDMTQATTFGNKHQGVTFGREVDGNDAQGSNGTAVVAPEIETTVVAPEIETTVVVPEVENKGDAPETVDSSKTNDPPETINNSEAGNHSQDQSANGPTLSGDEQP